MPEGRTRIPLILRIPWDAACLLVDILWCFFTMFRGLMSHMGVFLPPCPTRRLVSKDRLEYRLCGRGLKYVSPTWFLPFCTNCSLERIAGHGSHAVCAGRHYRVGKGLLLTAALLVLAPAAWVAVAHIIPGLRHLAIYGAPAEPAGRPADLNPGSAPGGKTPRVAVAGTGEEDGDADEPGEGEAGGAAKPVPVPLPPKSFEDHLSEGRERLANRAWEEARQAFREALAFDADHPESLLGLAVCATETGRRAEALRAYAEVVRVDPRNVPARAALARACLEDLDCRAALAHAAVVLEVDPANARVAADAARAALALEDFATATDVLAGVPEGFADPELAVLRGAVLLAGGRPDEALRVLQALPAVPAADAVTAILQARCLEALGRVTEGIGVLRELPTVRAALPDTPGDPGEPSDFRLLATLPVVPGTEFPADPAAEAADMLARHGSGRVALQVYAALGARRDCPVRVRVRHAELRLVLGDADGAYLLASEVVRERPVDIGGNLVLARLFTEKGLFSLAAERCRKVLDAGVADPRVRHIADILAACEARGAAKP